MTPNEPKKHDEKPAGPSKPPTPDRKPTDEPEDPERPGMNYVFKIAPADPKNSFDFEDVADK